MGNHSVAKQAIRSWISALYERFFGHAPSDNALRFAHGLSWSVLSGSIASLVMMALNIASGRLLGPDSYGLQSLIVTIATLLSTLSLFGLGNASIRALAVSKNRTEQESIIASSFYVVLLISIPVNIVFLAGHRLFLSGLTISHGAIAATILLGVAMSIKTLFDGFIRGREQFSYQAAIRTLEVAVAVIIFGLFFVALKQSGYLTYIVALIGSITVASIAYVPQLRPTIRRVDRATLRHLFHYGTLLFFGMVLGTVFNNIDRFLIAHYLNLQELGIYSAYYAASTNLIAQLVQMFINVFFPTVSRSSSKRSILFKVDRLFLASILPATLVLTAMISAIVLLFGRNFTFSLEYVVLFGFLAVFQFFSTVYAFIVTSIGPKLYRQLIRDTNVLNGIHILAYIALVSTHTVTIRAIVLLYILNAIALIIRQRQMLHRTLLSEIHH